MMSVRTLPLSTASRGSENTALPRDLLAHTEQASCFFKALADPTRLTILYMIAARGARRITSNALSQSLEISAPTVTHHMKKLLAAKLVTREQEGKWAFYSIHEDSVDTVAQIFARTPSSPRTAPVWVSASI